MSRWGCVLLVFGFLTLCSCRTRKTIVDYDPLVSTEEVLGINQAEFFSILENDTAKFNYLSTKIDLTIENDGKSNSLKMFLKTTKDSAMQANFSVVNLILARAHITPDSVTITQKRKKCYIKESAEKINSYLPVNMDYENLQALFHGEPIVNIKQGEKYYLFAEGESAVLSTHSADQIERLKREDYSTFPPDTKVIRYYLSEDRSRLYKMAIDLTSDSTHVEIIYETKTLIGELSAPENTIISMTGSSNNIQIKLEYGKVELNQPHFLSFSVPENYEYCE